MSEIVTKLKSRGYWDVSIRPESFVENRVSKRTDLFDILEHCRVSLRGWSYPHLDEKLKRIIGDHIEQDFEWDMYIEALRFHQSGLFVHLAGLSEDWRDQSGFWPPHPGWRPGSELSIERTVFRLTEIFDFAARLSETAAGDEVMYVEVKLFGLQGRKLSVSPDRMPFLPDKVAHDTSTQLFNRACLRPELIANRRDLALEAAASLFQQFDWDTQIGLLRDVQQQIGRT